MSSDFLHRPHPRGYLSTRRYNSYDRRYERSLTVPLVIVNGQTLCTDIDVAGGTCIQNSSYSSGGDSLFVTFQFPTQSVNNYATTKPWITFELVEETVQEVGQRPLRYATSFYRTFSRKANFSPPCGGTVTFTDYRGIFGDEDVFYVLGPIRWTYTNIGTPPGGCNTTRYRINLFQHAQNYFDIFPVNCSQANSLVWGSGEVDVLGFDFVVDDTTSVGGNYFTANACDGTPDPPGATYLVLKIYDDTGLVLEHRGEPNLLGIPNYPSLTIERGGEGFQAISQKYSWVRYAVTESSCECPDFNQRVLLPDWASRDWTGTNAGAFNPCKHILALKRIMGDPYIPAGDYIPDRSRRPFIP